MMNIPCVVLLMYMLTEKINRYMLTRKKNQPMCTRLSGCILLMVMQLIEFNSAQNLGRVILIRHGEKMNKAKTGDVHLAKRGQVRADAIARFFTPRFPSDDDMDQLWRVIRLPALSSVVAQSATNRYPSRRKVETAEPIATAAKVRMDLFDHEDIEGITNHVISEARAGRTTLVVWDHTTISDIANTLLDLPMGTVKWPMDRYDVIWDIDISGRSLNQFCQHLLYGDLWCPVNPVQVYPAINGAMNALLQGKSYIPMM